MYDQHIKLVWASGRVPVSLQKFYNPQKLDFYKFVRNWYNNGFENIDIKIYGLSKARDFIFTQFFENIDISVLQNEAIQLSKKRSNPSLSLFHKTLITNYISKINDAALRKKTAELIFKHNMFFSESRNNQLLNSKGHFSKETKIELLQKYNSSNNKILELFPNLGYSKDSLFQPISEFRKPLTLNDLNKDEIMKSFFNLLLYFIKNFDGDRKRKGKTV